MYFLQFKPKKTIQLPLVIYFIHVLQTGTTIVQFDFPFEIGCSFLISCFRFGFFCFNFYIDYTDLKAYTELYQ